MTHSFVSIGYNAVLYSVQILKRGSKKRMRILRAYVHYIFSYLFLGCVWGHQKRKERFLKYTIHFFDYATFIYLIEEIFIKKEYECELGTETPFIIDCGANIGMATLGFKERYPRSTILAFEPSKKTFELLERNVRDNKLQNVHIRNVALGEREGKITLFSEKTKRGSLVASVIRERIQNDVEKEEVNVVTLSSFIKKKVDLLKIDVEGAETAVLEELDKAGKLRFVRRMIIEYHHNIGRDKRALGKFLTLIEKNGFQYNIGAQYLYPYKKRQVQDIMIYCARKE